MRPEFSTSDSFETLRSCLLARKTFVVRGAVDAGLIANLYERAALAYPKWESQVPDRSDADRRQFAQGHIPATEIGGADLEALANSGYMASLMRNVFCWPRPLECPRDFLLRRILPPSTRPKFAYMAPVIPYHQDEYFGIASGPEASSPQLCFTMWLPLTACGRDAPGLSVVVGSDKPIVMGSPPEGWPAYIKKRYGNAIWSPELDAGDLLVFTSRVIHGSYVTPRMTKPRYSVEMRGGIN